ncbi:hypothetical protein Q5741_03980 [Paenibacillus sp. JX-17]|uniref:Bacterial Pleckstrin homology domain-containing protein n=1 Tax=Paenibacillus lacisoli TaxID=3064525 RepID=A0ABT9C8I8_9BACL|nr:hypothetical protein [Paenibacillus sp. JX-17]MDO7905568.1 hypothetical protein [Paenibacillus sp. JX-17]
MAWIARQPYTKVQRSIMDAAQITVHEERMLYLFPDRVQTRHREFELGQVFDMSFRPMGPEGGGGMLYLHTYQGVFSYTVESHPESFIQAFRQVRR